MTERIASRSAWALAGLVGLVVGSTWLVAVLDGNFLDLTSKYGRGQFFPIGFAFAGALVASRRPRNPVGWLLLLIAAASSLQAASGEYSIYRASAPQSGGTTWAAWVASWILVFGYEPGALLFLLLLFPNGRLLSARWRPVAWAGVGLGIVTVVLTWFDPRPISLGPGLPSVRNPTGVAGFPLHAWSLLGLLLWLGGLLLLVVAGFGVMLRYRRSRGDEREQLKWFAFAAGTSVVAILATSPVARGDVGRLAWTLEWVGGVGIAMPAAIAIAILRHRLYDIDRIINRTLVYTLSTGVVAVVYVAMVLLLQAVSPLRHNSPLAVAVSTLAVWAMFRPARARIQRVIDARFYRARYDAARTVEAFSHRLRGQVQLDELQSELVSVVHAAVQPTRISLWLREPETT